jgi:hypothetical protein
MSAGASRRERQDFGPIQDDIARMRALSRLL